MTETEKRTWEYSIVRGCSGRVEMLRKLKNRFYIALIHSSSNSKKKILIFSLHSLISSVVCHVQAKPSALMTFFFFAELSFHLHRIFSSSFRCRSCTWTTPMSTGARAWIFKSFIVLAFVCVPYALRCRTFVSWWKLKFILSMHTKLMHSKEASREWKKSLELYKFK